MSNMQMSFPMGFLVLAAGGSTLSRVDSDTSMHHWCCTTALPAGHQGASPITPATASHSARLQGRGKHPCARAGSRLAFPTAPAASWGIIWETMAPSSLPSHSRQGMLSNAEAQPVKSPQLCQPLPPHPGPANRSWCGWLLPPHPHTRDGHSHHHGTYSSREMGHGTPGKFTALSEGDRCTDSSGWATSIGLPGVDPRHQEHKATLMPPWPWVPSGRFGVV